MAHKNFVFSSVGDNTSFHSLWTGNNQNYDIYVIYYGNNDIIFNEYKTKVTFIEKRKGSKFQNFKYFYDNYYDIISKYDRFFILDDDIIFNVNDINDMFKLSRKYNLDICAPSFSHHSKICHPVTRHRSNVLLAYTNFVEVNTPLFNFSALKKLMEKLDYSLIGYGIDYLYISCNGLHKQDSYAIIHKIICTNPQDIIKKDKTRELEKIKGCSNRKYIWEEFAKTHKLPLWFKNKTYKTIYINNNNNNKGKISMKLRTK